jgi:hypothetical protein
MIKGPFCQEELVFQQPLCVAERMNEMGFDDILLSFMSDPCHYKGRLKNVTV